MNVMTEKMPTFFAETKEVFQFLEQQYTYRRLEDVIEYPDEPRDTTAIVPYVGTRVGVEIAWALSNHAISVNFVELLQPGVFPTKRSFYEPRPGLPKIIDVYNLAEVLGKNHDPDFILKDVDKTRTFYKNAKTIQESMPEILAGLARATQKYATTILQGDTSIFTEVVEHYAAKNIL